MPQEVVILSGISDTAVSLDGAQAVVKLKTAADNILALWSRAWDLHSTAVALAFSAKANRDRASYDHAVATKAEADRWKRRAAEQMTENDTLRGKLYGQIAGKVSLTGAAAAWFTSKAGLDVPNRYLASAGGSPIPAFPSFA